MKMLDYRVQTFLTLCGTRNYTRAAEQLHMTQPAVTQQIHFLEKQYGCALFRSEGRKLLLTPAGERLRTAMLTISDDEKQLQKEMQGILSGHSTLNIGATVTIGEFAMAAPLARYQAAHPETAIRMKIANTAELLKELEDGRIQLAAVEGYFDRRAYGCSIWKSERFICAASAQHHFRKKAKVLENLFGERLLIREAGSGTREILEKNLGEKNYGIGNFARRTEINSICTIMGMLRENGGISFLYETAAREDIENGRLAEIRLSDFSVQHDFCFLWDRRSIFAGQYRKISEELR